MVSWSLSLIQLVSVAAVRSTKTKYPRGLLMRKLIVHGWNFVFNAKVSPLRHIEDVAVRHYVLQALSLMWAVSFSAAIGSYTLLAVHILGHSILIAAAAITVVTYSVAAKKPALFTRGSGRRSDSEHE